jgi:hypothetical protein
MKREMFYIIKAELSYTKYQIHNWLLVLIALSLFAMIRGFNPTNLICFILFLQFFSYTYIYQLKEQRSSQYVLLGLSNNKIAGLRIIISLIGYSSVYTIGGISYLIFDLPSDGFHDTLAELVLFGGMSLMTVYTYLFLSDLFSLFQKKTNYVFFNIIVGAIILFALVFTAITVRNAYNSTISAGIIHIVFVYIGAIILAILSYITFKHRESHLGSR